MLAQMICCFTDLALARQEHEDVAAVVNVLPEFIDTIRDGRVQVVFARLLKRPVALLDREHAARDHDHRRGAVARCKMRSKPIRVNRRRGHDDLQIRAARQNLAQVAQQKVDVERTLMRLIDDDRVVGV